MSRTIRRACVAATAAVAALALLAPASSASVTGIADWARDPQFYGGQPASAAGIYRFEGANRAETSVYTSLGGFLSASGTELGTVALLASSESFPDALAAAPLAGSLSAPVLLASEDGTLTSSVVNRLRDYQTVIVVSGTSLLSDDVVAQVRDDDTSIIRYSGSNRYETAAALALAAMYWEDRAGNGDQPTTVQDRWVPYLADGLNFPDALAAGPFAARMDNGALLLTNGGTVPAATRAALEGRFADLSYTDPAAMEGMLSWWTNLGGTRNRDVVGVGAAGVAAAADINLRLVESYVGEDRYETAVLMGTKATDFGTGRTIYTLASGEKFEDAVVAGAFAANANGPLLLVRQNGVPASVSALLKQTVSNEDGIVIVGGPASVSSSVSTELVRQFVW